MMTKRNLLFSFYGILALAVACTFGLGWLGLCLGALCCLFACVGCYFGSRLPDSGLSRELAARLKELETRVNDELVKRAFEGRR